MRIVVFGATGRTGRCIVDLALAQRHVVIAFARNAAAVATPCPTLQGDVLDPATVERAVRGQDAVLCALGIKP